MDSLEEEAPNQLAQAKTTELSFESTMLVPDVFNGTTGTDYTVVEQKQYLS